MTIAPDSPLATLWCPSPNVEPRQNGLKPDMLLLHYTGMDSAEAALDWLTRQESGVSCHYLVDAEGRIAQMVPESERAWHAGQSLWQGETDINSCSIGIEIHNPGTRFRLSGFPRRRDARRRGALSRYPEPPRNSAASRARPFRRGARAESEIPARNSTGSDSRAQASVSGSRRRQSRTIKDWAPATKARWSPRCSAICSITATGWR